MNKFKSEVRFTIKEIDKFLIWIGEYIGHRGGMGNRIDAWDIEDILKGKKRYLKQIKEGGTEK